MFVRNNLHVIIIHLFIIKQVDNLDVQLPSVFTLN